MGDYLRFTVSPLPCDRFDLIGFCNVHVCSWPLAGWRNSTLKALGVQVRFICIIKISPFPFVSTAMSTANKLFIATKTICIGQRLNAWVWESDRPGQVHIQDLTFLYELGIIMISSS